MTGQDITIRPCLVDDHGVWTVRARFPDTPGGKPRLHSKSTGYKVNGNNKRRAEASMREIVAEWEREVNSLLLSGSIEFSGIALRWMDRKRLSIRANTYASYTDILNKHILPAFGKIRLCDITRADIQRYYDRLRRDGLSTCTLKKHRVLIKGILDDAVMDGLIPVNVAVQISLPKRQKYVGHSLTEAQVSVLLAKLTEQQEPLRAAVTLALGYGLRRSEICGLRWEDVDFENKQIHIRNTTTEYRGTYYEVEATKTPASCRDLCFVPGTEDYFLKLLSKQKQSGSYTGKVCAHTDGRLVRPEYVTRLCQRFLKSCGYEGIRLHDLRHTAASILARRVPIKLVQAFLGHEDVQTSLNIYTHTNMEDAFVTSKAMAEVFSLPPLLDVCSESCSET